MEEEGNGKVKERGMKKWNRWQYETKREGEEEGKNRRELEEEGNGKVKEGGMKEMW